MSASQILTSIEEKHGLSTDKAPYREEPAEHVEQQAMSIHFSTQATASFPYRKPSNITTKLVSCCSRVREEQSP